MVLDPARDNEDPQPTKAQAFGGAVPLPPTVNMHCIGHCDHACHYCYARFAKAQTKLPLEEARRILASLATRGVDRITFAGGEPTLHPRLLEMLMAGSELGLVANVVTNGSRIDRGWCRTHFPWLRWLTVSCDSEFAATNDAHGRRPRKRLAVARPAAEQTVCIAGWLHEWNAVRPTAAQVRLKINIVVTRVNARERPARWLRSLAPTRIKLMQQVIVRGENDDAAELCCDDLEFAEYARRVSAGRGRGCRGRGAE